MEALGKVLQCQFSFFVLAVIVLKIILNGLHVYSQGYIHIVRAIQLI